MAEIFVDSALHFWAVSSGMSFFITMAADLDLVIMSNETPPSPNIKIVRY